MRVQFIDYSNNEDLPAHVKNALGDDGMKTLFRAVLNSHLREGRSEMHAYTKAYRALADAGYERNNEGKWVKKSMPTVSDVHVNRPLGSGEDDEEDEDDDEEDELAAKADQMELVDTESNTSAHISLIKRFLPPKEVLAAAQSAFDVGVVVDGITENLLAHNGITQEQVRKIAGYFANGASEASEVACNAWGGHLARKWVRRLIQKYDPDQPRDEQGRWGEGGAGPDAGPDAAPDAGPKSAKAELARASYKPSTAEKQRKADHSEQKLSKALGAERTQDNAPFDLLIGNHAVEVKTLIDNKNDKITMHPESRQRKLDFARKEGVKTHTVVADARGGKTKYYYAKGVGSFRLSSMTSMSLGELKSVLSGKLKKYDPDQPRDDQGCWGEGGGTAHISGGMGSGGKGHTAKPAPFESKLPKGDRSRERAESVVQAGRDYLASVAAADPAFKDALEKAEWSQGRVEKMTKEMERASKAIEKWEKLPDSEKHSPEGIARMDKLAFEMDTAVRKVGVAQENLRKSSETVLAKLETHLHGVGGENKIQIGVQHSMASRMQALAEQFGRLTGAQGAVLIKETTDPRGFYRQFDESVNVTQGASEGVVFHEMGHWLEHKTSGAMLASQSFLDHRTFGTPEQKLGGSYAAHEEYRPDKFINDYTGKIYKDGNTEVLSMGMQHLAEDPVKFYKQDPEHFYFTLGQIKAAKEGGHK